MKKMFLKKGLAILAVVTMLAPYCPISAYATSSDIDEALFETNQVGEEFIEDSLESEDVEDDEVIEDSEEIIEDEGDNPTDINGQSENNPSSSDAGTFEVTKDEYEKNYNNSKYEVVDTITYYMYGTRTKSTTTSGEASKSGWTKYDTKTSTSTSGYVLGTPISTITSYDGNKKTVKSAVDKGYYYYAYVVADPNNTSDWCYYADKTRAKVISHMKSNFSKSSVWDEKRLRYFWYISSKDLGATSGKLKKTIPYCADSTVSVGTLSQKGTHYYDIPMFRYKQAYKVKTETTVNYFYKWSEYTWSDWSTQRRSIPNDGTMTEKSEVHYIVKEKGVSVSAQGRKDISDCTVNVLSGTSFIYSAEWQDIAVEIKDNGIRLSEGQDYTLSGIYGINAGSYTMTITGVGKYFGVRNIEYKIDKANPSLYFKNSSITITAGNNLSNPLTYTKGLTVSYRSSNTKAATINSKGNIEVKGAGTTTITAVSQETNNYNSKTASYTLIIKAPAKPGKPKGLKAKYSYGKATLTWKKASKAQRYQLRYKAKSKKSWHYLTVSSNSYTLNGLAPGTKYSFNVRSVSGAGSAVKQSKWSATVTKKTSSNYNNVYYHNSYSKNNNGLYCYGSGTEKVMYLKKGSKLNIPGNTYYIIRRSDGKILQRPDGTHGYRFVKVNLKGNFYEPAYAIYSGYMSKPLSKISGSGNYYYELYLDAAYADE